MPIVTEMEYYPAQLKRMLKNLEQGLLTCEDEHDLMQFEKEPDLAAVREHEIWAQYINEKIELRKITIEKGENTCL